MSTPVGEPKRPSASMGTAPRGRRSIALLEPLRHRDFRLLWAGQSISMFGNAIYGVALPFQILALGGSPLQLGIGFAISSGVQLVVILFGGAFVDRLPRRRVILASDFASGVAVGLAALLGITQRLRVEHVYVLAAFFGLATSFYIPAIGAIVPELVPKDILVAGNSLRGLSRQTAKLAGPLAGGVIVALVGPPVAFAVDAATFFVSFGLFVLASSPRTPTSARRPLFEAMREGLSFVFSVPWLWISIVGFGFVNAFYLGALTVGLPLLVRDVLLGGAAVFGLIGSAAGIGQILGGLAVGSLRTRRLGPTMYACYALTALSLAGYGIAPSLLTVLLASGAFAASLMAANTLWESALQRNVPGELLGRVTSVDYFGSFLVGPVAPLLAVGFIDRTGPAAIFVLGGAISFIFTVAAVALSRSIRELP